jgi:ABC-2 type transport system permease protein
MLTIPLILLLFITAATLGGEINEGQMLLEVTRVKDKKVLLIGSSGYFRNDPIILCGQCYLLILCLYIFPLEDF